MNNKKRVVVIDDEEVHLYTAKWLLESDQIEVITHRGPFGATNCVRASRPDLILLDINMPALSGENLMQLLKDSCASTRTPILFYSSNDEATLRHLVAAHGVEGYVCKGDIAGLHRKTSEHLGV